MRDAPQFYAYDPETGKLAERSFREPHDPFTPQADPRASKNTGETVYITPAFATQDAPPGIEDGKWPCFVGGAWVQVDDHRGRDLFDITTGALVTVETLGPLPEGLTATAPSTSHDRWDEQAGRWVADERAKAAAGEAERRRLAIAADADRSALAGMLAEAWPEVIETYVDEAVTDLASARELFKGVLKLMAAPAGAESGMGEAIRHQGAKR